MRSHQWIDERSRALHEAVASKLKDQPELLAVARSNLERWLAASPSPVLKEWQRLLDQLPLPELLTLLVSASEEAKQLRQSSPFAGLLTPAERQAILDWYESSIA